MHQQSPNVKSIITAEKVSIMEKKVTHPLGHLPLEEGMKAVVQAVDMVIITDALRQELSRRHLFPKLRQHVLALEDHAVAVRLEGAVTTTVSADARVVVAAFVRTVLEGRGTLASVLEADHFVVVNLGLEGGVAPGHHAQAGLLAQLQQTTL